MVTAIGNTMQNKIFKAKFTMAIYGSHFMELSSNKLGSRDMPDQIGAVLIEGRYNGNFYLNVCK